jgi:hydroxymethylpyrimidine/phosphomethylpyrimidine kinase
MSSTMPVILTIAGSDSGGGAGIQADLKTFSALGVFGTSAITAVTAQNTQGVRGFVALDPAFVRAQIDAVVEDFDVAAVKIGMLANAEIVDAVARALREHELRNVVLDPVMVAGSGDPLLEDEAVEAIRDRLLPLAHLVTPNVPEAGMLLERELADDDTELRAAAKTLHQSCDVGVLLKGGHRRGDADDLFVAAGTERVLEAERVPGNVTHGTGCTLSSAIAAFLARGRSMDDAVAQAKDYVTRAIAEGVQLGMGQGNLHFFWEYYGNEGLP